MLLGRAGGDFLAQCLLYCWASGQKTPKNDKTLLPLLFGKLNYNQVCVPLNACVYSSIITHCGLPDSLHAASRQRGRGVQTHSSNSILVERNVQPTVYIETWGEDLGAVAPHTARSPLPGCCC